MMNGAEQFENYMIEVRNLFLHLFRKVTQEKKKLEDVTFTMGQLNALGAFHEDREYSMGELSKNAAVKMPTMTEMVDKLEKHGMLKRLKDERDRRVVKVGLTAKGKKMHKDFVRGRKNELAVMFGKLSRQDQKELITGLQKISGILQKITTEY